jgi:hypothetical protein
MILSLSGEMDEIEESKWWKFWSSANFDRKKFEKDKELIVNITAKMVTGMQVLYLIPLYTLMITKI